MYESRLARHHPVLCAGRAFVRATPYQVTYAALHYADRRVEILDRSTMFQSVRLLPKIGQRQRPA